MRIEQLFLETSGTVVQGQAEEKRLGWPKTCLLRPIPLMRPRHLLSAAAFFTALLTLSSTLLAAPGVEPLFGFRVGPAAPFRLGPLLRHTDGNFYGAMVGTGNAMGGDTGNGAVFRLTPSGQIDWLSFSGVGGPRPGKSPEGGLTARPDGWLWGTTTAGGPAGTMGSIYRIRPDTGEFQSIVGLSTDAPGQYPATELVSDGTGWLWGTTNQGGAGLGVIFKVSEVTGEYKLVASLTSGSGKPTGPGSLTFADGYIWGVAGGGAHSSGTLFRIDPAAALPAVPLVVADFTGTATIAPKPRGLNPTGKLTPDGLGYLWGVADFGAAGFGALFKLKTSDVGTANYPVTTVIEFSGNGTTNKGSRPRGSLVADGDGMLWGVTAFGGSGSVGTVFKVNPADNTLTTVVQFGAALGATSPANPLTYDGNGYMWGIATSGSGSNWAFYKIKVADGTFSKVAEFASGGPTPDGTGPKAAPIGKAGGDWMYGTTSFGGKFGFGTLYRINAVTGDHSTLVHFTGTTGAATGANPGSKLHYHTDGTLWGTTNGGGYNGNGTVFRYNPTTGVFTHIASFTIAGAAPMGVLTTGADGFIWGTTSGGSNGTLFKIDPATGLLTTVKIFSFNDSPDGNSPRGGLVSAADGFLWGTTYRGGGMSGGANQGYGTIFKVNPVTGQFTSVIKFTGSGVGGTGSQPIGDLVLDAQGKIWGVTTQNVFTLDPVTETLTANVPIASATGYPLELSLGGGLYHHHDDFYYGVNEAGTIGPDGDVAGGGIVFRQKPGLATATTVGYNPPGDVYPKNVSLAGTMTMDGVGGSYSFEWGTTTALGNSTAAVGINAAATTASASIPQLKGLTPYLVRLRVDTAAGTAYGNIQSFATRELGSNENLGITVQSPIGRPLVHNASTIDLGDVRVGQSGQESVTIKYIGNSSLTLSGVAITGTNADQFTASPLATTPALTHAGSRGFVITYAPTAAGNHQATLTINSNDAARPSFIVQLAGSGVSEGDIAVEVGAGIGLDTEGDEVVDFGLGTIGVGTAQSFLIRNTGNAALGNVSAQIIGPNAADFVVADSVPININAGASAAFGVTFTPSAAGERSAVLRLTSDDPDEGTIDIDLTGRTAAAANIAVELQAGGTPVVHDVSTGYGTVAIGLTLSKTFIIRNTGNAPMTGISVTYTGGGSFTVSSAPVATIYPGESSQVVITFVPTIALPQQAIYTVASNAGNNAAFKIRVNGQGSTDPVPEIAVEDSGVGLTSNSGAIALGTVQAGTPVSKTLTIRNGGTGSLSGVSASFGAGSSAAFTITSAPAGTVAASATTNVTIKFTPQVNGTAVASLLIASNDADENPFRINFTATGANVPEPEISVEESATALVDGTSTVNFGTVATNLTVTKTFTIKNTGAASLTGISATLAAGSSAAFSIITPPATAASLAVNASTTVAVRFDPSAVAAFNGTLRIASNDSDENPFDIALTGTGEPTNAPTFTTEPPHRLVQTGAGTSLSATVAGAMPMSLQWKKNGAKVAAGGNGLTYNIAAAKPADVGIYTLFASNSSGDGTSSAAYVGVVTKTEGSVLLKEGATLTLNCTAAAPVAAGVSVTYHWKNSAGLLNDGGRISGAQTKTLKITRVELGDTSIYTCVVTLVTPGTDPQCESGNVAVSVVRKPTINPFVLPTVSVGETVNLPPVTANYAAKFSATGLPPGVTLDGATGLFIGKPTAPRIVNGAVVAYQVKVTATNLAGASDPFPVDWMVEGLDPSLIGTFNGLVARDPFTNFGFGGTIQITTTVKGVVTGSAILAGQKYPITGVLDASLGDNPSAVLTVKRTPASLGNLQLVIDSIEIAGNRLSGTLVDPQFTQVMSQLVLGDGTAGSDNGDLVEARLNAPGGIALVGDGGYIADTGNHTIRVVANDTVSVFAGESGTEGTADGTGVDARFNGPEGLALDAALNLFVADTGNGRIRKITPGGVVTTVTVPPGTFVSPCALIFDDKGNLIVVDRGNHTIKKVAPNGSVTTLAGKNGQSGFKDGSGTGALFNGPRGITYDAKLKAFFVADTNNEVIRKVLPAGGVTTYAGAAGVAGDAPGPLANARFIAPTAIASDGQGTLIVADTLLVQITPGGIVATITDYVDAGSQADRPLALAIDPAEGAILVADAGLHGIVNHALTDPVPGAAFVARRTIWTTASPVPSTHVGSYTAGIATNQGGDVAFPQGYGFATLAVTKTGTATWGGKAADGSPITGSTVVGPDGEIVLHTMLYKNTGSIQGLTYVDDSLDLFSAGSIDAPFDWYKVAQANSVADRAYKGGLPLHGVQLLGGKYTPANQLFDFLGLTPGTTTGNAAASFSAGGLAAPFDQLLDVKSPNTFAVSAAANPHGVKLTVTASSGLFTGSFNDGNPARKATLSGVFVRNTAGNVKAGRGHFLLPQDTATNGPVLSGQVVIDGN